MINHVYACIDIILEKSAPGAFHTSGEMFDPPKCHPRTRTHILTKIMAKWDEMGSLSGYMIAADIAAK